MQQKGKQSKNSTKGSEHVVSKWSDVGAGYRGLWIGGLRRRAI